MDLIREINELNYEFCTSLDPQGIREALVKRLVEGYEMAAAGIWRLDAGKSSLTLAAAAGDSPVPLFSARDSRPKWVPEEGPRTRSCRWFISRRRRRGMN